MLTIGAHQSFLDLCVAGKADPAEIDDIVSQWHDEENGRSLEAMLGLTHGEFMAWVMIPKAFDELVILRRTEAMNQRDVAQR